MKTFAILLLSCFSTLISSQICSCSQMPDLKDLISCKTTTFQNGAKIYWEFDCNSSWITFQNGALKKKIFELDKTEMEFTGRLGYKSWTELGNSFLGWLLFCDYDIFYCVGFFAYKYYCIYYI